MKFHDGTDFNADAVKFNLDRYLNDKTSRRASEISSIQTMDVTDPYTLKITLKAPFAPFLANLVDRAGMMLSPKAIQAGGADFSRKPVGAGTGAFKFVEWVNNDHLTMDAQPELLEEGRQWHAIALPRRRRLPPDHRQHRAAHQSQDRRP